MQVVMIAAFIAAQITQPHPVLLTNVGRRPPQLLALSTSSNFSVILSILFAKLAKTPAIAVATLIWNEC